jgi:hypothetical protein
MILTFAALLGGAASAQTTITGNGGTVNTTGASQTGVSLTATSNFPDIAITTGNTNANSPSSFHIFNSTLTELLRVQSNGNIIVGNNGTDPLPTMKFAIRGIGQIFGVDNTASFAAKNGGPNGGSYETYLWPRYGDTMYINYGSSGFNIRNNSSATKMFMDDAGNVALGIYAYTLSPGAKLDVSGSARFGYDFNAMPPLTYGGIQIGEYGAGDPGELQFLSVGGDPGWGFRFHGNANTGALLLDRMWHASSYSDFMAFNSSGVGIGSTTPTGLLQIGEVGSNYIARFQDMLTTAAVVNGVLLDMTTNSEIHVGNIQIGTLAMPIIQTMGATGQSSLYLNKDSDNDVIIGGNTTPHGHGLQVQSTGPSAFAGALTVAGPLTVNNSITATTVYADYQDVAEWVPAAASMPAGTVVVISDDSTNTVAASTHAYDTGVAGVVSPNPGLLLGATGPSKAKIATTGRVKVRVDASKQPIRMGDLLVTSDRPGMAMKSEPLDVGSAKIHRPGTLIGKALEPLPSGEGEILVLLSLQ